MDDQAMQGRVALVAGASKGIGAATAEAFANAGAAVVLGACNEEALRLVVARIEPGDVSEDAAAAGIAAAVHGEGVRVDRAFTGRANLFAELAVTAE